MKTRVMLIYPPGKRFFREDRCQIPAGNAMVSPPFPPTDLLYMAATAEKAGAECIIRDYTSPRERSLEDLLRDVAAYGPDYLVISTTTPTLPADLSKCRAVKEKLPSVKIVAKGAHFLSRDREAMAAFPHVDAVLRGEPEGSMEDIVRGRSFDGIAGLTWRRQGELARNEDRPFIGALDDLPFPARHLVDNQSYVRLDTGKPQAVIKVSRGCPHHCFYCLATPVSGSTVRRRSPENILAEIRECVERYGIHDFLLWSDLFNADRSWVFELCDAIAASGLDISWAANSRADRMDREMAEAMRRAGCTLASVGVESGNQGMLDRMNKGLTLEQIRGAVTALKDAGISTVAYYQFGLPWETRQTAEDTIRFSLELDTDYASFFVSVPFPGTRFHDYVLSHGLAGRGPEAVCEGALDAYYRPVVPGHFLDGREIKNIRRQAMKRFYIRPGYIVRHLRKAVTDRGLIRLIKGAMSLLLGSLRVRNN